MLLHDRLRLFFNHWLRLFFNDRLRLLNNRCCRFLLNNSRCGFFLNNSRCRLFLNSSRCGFFLNYGFGSRLRRLFVLNVHDAALRSLLLCRLRFFLEEGVRRVLVAVLLLVEVVLRLLRLAFVRLGHGHLWYLQQILRSYLQRSKVLLVELGVVGVAELLAEHRQIDVADNDLSALAHELHQQLLLLQLAGVLQRLVVVAESLHEHTVQTVYLLNLYVEVAHHVRREVVACQLEQHSVGVYRVGLVSYHIYERGVAVVRELAHSRRVVLVEHLRTAFPNVLEVELAALQTSALVHALHNHACHLCHGALRILLHHRVQVFDAALIVAVVQLAQSADEEELVAVGSQRESMFGDSHIGAHLLVASRLERVVGRSV